MNLPKMEEHYNGGVYLVILPPFLRKKIYVFNNVF